MAAYPARAAELLDELVPARPAALVALEGEIALADKDAPKAAAVFAAGETPRAFHDGLARRPGEGRSPGREGRRRDPGTPLTF